MKKNVSTYSKSAPESIQALFNNIAKDYDRTNALLSFQLHKIWNRTLILEMLKGAPKTDTPKNLLDLCSGTGDIAFGYLKRSLKNDTPLGHAYLLDFSTEMLACAKHKAKKLSLDESQITYIQGDATAISLKDESVDSVTIAYGLRNVNSSENCAKEVLRVLRPGGRFGILELTRPSNSFMRFGHSIYLNTILPYLGRLFASDKQAYCYLSQSIQSFLSPSSITTMLKATGFCRTWTKPLMGGIATLIFGEKG